MSLFQTKEWWSTRVSANEEFDDRHLCLANIDNNPNQQMKIIVGSFSGFLRMYLPHRSQYKIEDLLFEQKFEFPIIQIAAGLFLPGSNEQALAVLFFKKLSILTFSPQQSQVLQSKKVYSHNLERNAYNMTFGTFGGQKKDFICVQSCDGMLTIYEHDKLSCMCQLSDFLLPGPIGYNIAIDSFIIQNSSYQLECYRYSQIGASFNSQKENKKILPDWQLCIGDQALKLECVQRNNKIVDIVVLTEEAIFIVTQVGTIRNQKKFEYPAANFIINQIPEKINQTTQDKQSGELLTPLNLLISSFTNHLLVYDDFALTWATRTDHVAHSVCIGTFDNTRGLIVILNDEGWLSVNYLGTDSPPIAQSFLKGNREKELSYQEMDNLYIKTLEQINIKENPKNKKPEPTEILNLNVQVIGPFYQTDYVEESEKYFSNAKGQPVAIKVRVALTFSGVKANNVQIYFSLPNNIFIEKNPIQIDELKGNATPYNFEVVLYSFRQYFPYQNYGQIQVTYNNFTLGKAINKDPRCANQRFMIPIGLQCCFSVPQKQQNFKITVQANKEIPMLSDLFQDLSNFQENIQECLKTPNSFTFLLGNGVDATVLYAKNSTKYRMQSSKFEGIWFILLEILTRLDEQARSKKEQAIEFTFTDAVPLQDFFNIIDEHYLLRTQLQDMKGYLEKKATEFRTIQKRLLTRFKEKNPAPLNNLDLLLQKNFEDLMMVANKYEAHQQILKNCSHRLSVTASLINTLIKLRFNLSRETYKLVMSTLSPQITNDECEIGWEEITNANIIYLLKMALNKEMKETQLNIEKIDDFNKFKKQISFFIDKISKGAF